MNKVVDKLEGVLHEDQDLDPEFVHDVSRFIRGSLVNATELLQTKRNLGRTQYAQRIQKKQRRAMKNSPLQSGGVLTVAQARHMGRRRQEVQMAKARRLVEAKDQKAFNAVKGMIFEAAKAACNGGCLES